TLMHYFTSRRPHTRSTRDWSSDVCSSDLGSKGGAILVDMTTSEPTLAREIYDAAKAKGVYSLDAPVSGGDVGAKNTALSIMIGGDKDVVDAVTPIFECMGKTIIHQGPAGSGQHTKMVNQILIASNMIAVCEGLL